MIKLTHARGKRFALFGLGGSGIATAKALLAGGAEVAAFDDNEAGRAKAKSENIPVVDLNEADWSRFDSFVLSPGVPLTHPKPHWTVEKARAANVETIGDIELFCRERKRAAPYSKLVCITGTNGKSTTTALTAHILREADMQVEMGGNIGRPALDLDMADDKVFVLECSSYQIDLAPSLDPDVAIMLNISEDHIDRHGSVQHYANVKERLVVGVKKEGLAIIGVDDTFSAAMAERSKKRAIATCEISVLRSLQNGIFLQGTRLMERGRALVDLSTTPNLRGVHNAQNAACAFAAARACGVKEDNIVHAMRTFPGLEHRMQRIGRVGKVVFVNDSKATNADAAAKALASFDDIYWIAGGRAKTGGIGSLNKYASKIRHSYLIGEAADEFEATLKNWQVALTISGVVKKAVEQALLDALASAVSKPIILFSPACASFDQFKNFEERGDAFVKAVADQPNFEKIA